MDDNCGEWVECMGVASGSGWNQWVWIAGKGCGWNLMGVASGCGCKELYIFPHIIYPCILFLQQHPYFLFI